MAACLPGVRASPRTSRARPSSSAPTTAATSPARSCWWMVEYPRRSEPCAAPRSMTTDKHGSAIEPHESHLREPRKSSSVDEGAGASLIAIDWGTTRFRAWLVASDGAILDRVDAAAGILSV